MTTTLADALPQEQERCRELLAVYKTIGPAGTFGAIMIEAALARADQAVMSGDLVEMLRSYKELKECE